MKGDINLKINKKSALLLVGLLSAFTAADFVSMINVKTSGGISIEKETMTIGSVVLRSAVVNFVGNTKDSGVSNARLDVRGSRIKINVWKRIG